MYVIVKAHGGEIKVAKKKGEGSEFIISATNIKPVMRSKLFGPILLLCCINGNGGVIYH